MIKQKDEIDSLINISDDPTTLFTPADEPFMISDDVDFNGPGEIVTIEEVERRTGRRLITRRTISPADAGK